jgi:hypothetical protein
MKRKKSFVLLLACLSLVMITACGTMQKSHTTHYAKQQNLINQGKIAEVAQKLALKGKKGGRDGVLNSLAAGYYYLFMQDYQRSHNLFRLAENQVTDFENRAKINARDAAAAAKSTLTSDMELPYKGQVFEKIMINTLAAMNYLFEKDLEGANVEIRRAEMRQKEAVDKHQKELKKIEKQKRTHKIDDNSFNSIYNYYNVLDEYSSKVINSFQNGFTYFLGGMVYELNRNPENAYRDYRKSFSLYKNKYTLEKLIELSRHLDMQNEYEEWCSMHKELFNGEMINDNPGEDSNPGNAELVVVYFCGNVPRKTPVKFSLRLYKKSFLMAFPFYDKNTFYIDNRRLEINRNEEKLGKTELVLEFTPIVIKALKEKLPGLVVRQILRMVAKNELENSAKKRGGSLGGLGAKIFNLATTRADLRGWYELPCNIQIFRSKIEPGRSSITLKEISDSGAYSLKSIDIDIPENKTAIVFVQQLSSRTSTHTVLL